MLWNFAEAYAKDEWIEELQKKDEEDDDFPCRCLICEKVFATGDMSGGWTQRERAFCSKECEDKMPDWKTEIDDEEEVEEYETCWICKKTDATVHTIDYWPGHSGHDITICSACNNEECESCGTKDGTVVPHLYGNTLSMMVCSACK